MEPTGRILRSEPDVLAATRRESDAEPNGAMILESALVSFALFFCGPSSASVASSAADVLPASVGFLRGRPRGRPVGGLERCLARDVGRDAGFAALSWDGSGT